MTRFSETLLVERDADGILAIREHRSYPSGVLYDAVLYIQADDAGALRRGLERLQETGVHQELLLRDGRMVLSLEERSEMIILEIFRDAALPHGGHDAMDVGPEGLTALVAALQT